MSITIDNLNERSYGSIYVTNGVGTQNTSATPGVYTKVTQFTNNGPYSNLVVPDYVNNLITTYTSGIWLCLFSMTFNPGATDTFYFQVWAGPLGSETSRHITGAFKIQAPNSITNISSSGFVELNTYDVIDLRVACIGANKPVAIKEASLTIGRFSR